MVPLVKPPGFQAYVPFGIEGVAVKEPVCPTQMVSLLTVMIGVGFTVTVPDAVGLIHPDNEVYTTV